MNKHEETTTELQIQRTNRWLTEGKGWGEKVIGEGDQEAQTSSCKISES